MAADGGHRKAAVEGLEFDGLLWFYRDLNGIMMVFYGFRIMMVFYRFYRDYFLDKDDKDGFL